MEITGHTSTLYYMPVRVCAQESVILLYFSMLSW